MTVTHRWANDCTNRKTCQTNRNLYPNRTESKRNEMKIMSEIWKTLGADEREAYRTRARDDQKRYKAEQADKVGGLVAAR